MKTVEVIREHLDKGKVCGALLIDMKKAFDSVRKETLLAKMRAYGVEDTAFTLLNSYLSDRQQSVRTEEDQSSFLEVKIGLPQGSILGPLGFLVVINDLPKVCRGAATIFADDTSVIFSENSHKELEKTMQSDLLAVANWCVANGLMLNPEKTQYMVFTGKKAQAPDLNISLTGIRIERVPETKFLGCWLDDRLKATSHVSHLVKKLNKTIFLLKNICKTAGYDVAKLIYDAYFYSNTIYCTAYWSTASKKHLRKLFSVQRRALKAITPMQDQQDIFGRLNILPLPQMLTYCVCVFLHEQLSGRGPTVLKLTMQGEGRQLRTTG